ncbi:hypothetical protein PR202_ga27285 [Eleusine coracana subsp. coracana]|uniref:Phospholipase D n=1 Tax=Eleusine coracana subsp. coracana TaxID=191504 RepID=A0AAV5DG41_ELECO|nr:hypothetical protein PR202_ga27285 [Eleusine coracana subsp. coracana]
MTCGSINLPPVELKETSKSPRQFRRGTPGRARSQGEVKEQDPRNETIGIVGSSAKRLAGRGARGSMSSAEDEGDGAMASSLLHGSLDIWIHEARNLPNKDILSKTMSDVLRSSKMMKPAADAAMMPTSDPYVTVQVASSVVARTFVIPDNENPVWEQHFLVPVAHEVSAVTFLVKDSDLFGAELIGAVSIRAEDLKSLDRIQGVYPVLEPSGKHCAPGAVLRISVQYMPVARLTMYHHGVTPGPDFPGVPNTYFPLRRGGKVTLYQDAHVPEGSLPEISLGNNNGFYGHGQCWRDVYDAIAQARKLVYITGWSVFHTIHLVRDSANNNKALGDLLKSKSQEGVRVLLLVWDDPTSRNVFGMKMVLDDHGPREPWHDLHSKIDGPAAYDVLKNFEERWLKAAKRSGVKKLSKSQDTLLWIEKIPDIVAIDDEIYSNNNDPERWDVQIFRSIDSNSVKGFPKDPREATSKNLVCGKNVLIDMSVHTAYVNAIRAAQHFIYIENQYFLGSSFKWNSHKDVGANNLIPIEIALKIANKIYANERFSAYIVVPMWPEGNPTGAPTQRILYWQKKTMQMMYEIIYKALEEVGLDDKYEPQDYLNFFCLGNREAEDTPSASGESFSSSNPQIFGYRMSLWAEHIGTVEESFTRPESLECMRHVRHIGEQNWEQFVSNKVTEMRGHLLKYPVSVDRVGKVKPLLDCAAFPDLGGNICGSFLHIQENLTI